MHLLPTTLGVMHTITESRNNARYAVTGVHLKLNEDGSYLAQATDCKFLMRVHGTAQFKTDEYPIPDAMVNAPDGHSEGLIPNNVWKEVFSSSAKLTKKNIKPILKNVAIKMGETSATIGATNLDSSPVVSARYVEGKFPPCEQFVPKQSSINKAIKVNVDAKKLIELLHAMVTVSEFDNNEVEISLIDSGEGKIDRIYLEAKNESMRVEGLLVPLI